MFEKNAPSYSTIRDCGKIKDFPIKRNFRIKCTFP